MPHFCGCVPSRPDLSYASGRLASYSEDPGEQHEEALHRLFRYLKGPLTLSLTYKGAPSLGALSTLVGFCDASHGGDLDDRKSIGGHALTLGGGAICWKSDCRTLVDRS